MGWVLDAIDEMKIKVKKIKLKGEMSFEAAKVLPPHLLPAFIAFIFLNRLTEEYLHNCLFILGRGVVSAS